MRRILPAALMALLLLAGCKTELYGNLSEREANAMIAALGTAGIPASKSRDGDEGLTVFVDDSRFAEAMRILDEHGLPGQQYETMGDIFRKEGFVSSPTEERARLIYALSQELSETIGAIDGVLTARIHVVLPEDDMLGRETKPSSASVFVRYAPDQPVEDYTSQIKLLVANSIEGLLYDNITVVMVPASSVPGASAAASSSGYENILGVWVHPGSATRVWSGLAVVAVLILALAGVALWPHLARRRAEPVYDDGL